MSDGSVHSTGGMPSPGALQIAGMLQHFLASRAAESENPPAVIHGPAGAVAVASSGNGDGGYTKEGAKSSIDGDSMMQPKKEEGQGQQEEGQSFWKQEAEEVLSNIRFVRIAWSMHGLEFLRESFVRDFC